jgi:hypothetical protein
MPDSGAPDDSDDRGVRPAKGGKGMTVFGRQGSPTMTLALPFSHVEVKADDGAALVPALAALTARLARALQSAGLADATTAELAAIATALDALAGKPTPDQPTDGSTAA